MTVEERAQTVIAEIGRYSESSEIRALIIQALRDQIEECAQIVEEGSKPQKGLTDHVYRGDWRLGLCSCGLQKEAHPRRAKTRKQILKDIRALAAPTESEEKGAES